MNNKSFESNRGILPIFLSMVFGLSYLHFYNQIFNNKEFSQYVSDLPLHIQFITDFFEGKMFIPHPGFHYIVYFFSKISTVSLNGSAVLVLSVFVTLTTHIIFRAFVETSSNAWTALLLSIAAFLFSPIYIPNFNDKLYLGQIHPNIWHNPTLIVLKVFILLIILYTPKLFEGEVKRGSYIKYGVLAVLMAVSTWVKPNFIISYLPAVMVVYLFFKRDISKFVTIGITSVPSLLILLYQYMRTYEDNDATVIVDIMGVWGQWSNSPIFSIVISVAFPLSLLIFRWKTVTKNDHLMLSWVTLLVAICQFAFFAESGSRYGHGNFGWGMHGAMIAVVLFSLIELYKWINEKFDWRTHISLSLLGFHLISGLVYFIKIFSGGSFF